MHLLKSRFTWVLLVPTALLGIAGSHIIKGTETTAKAAPDVAAELGLSQQTLANLSMSISLPSQTPLLTPGGVITIVASQYPNGDLGTPVLVHMVWNNVSPPVNGDVWGVPLNNPVGLDPSLPGGSAPQLPLANFKIAIVDDSTGTLVGAIEGYTSTSLSTHPSLPSVGSGPTSVPTQPPGSVGSAP